MNQDRFQQDKTTKLLPEVSNVHLANIWIPKNATIYQKSPYEVNHSQNIDSTGSPLCQNTWNMLKGGPIFWCIQTEGANESRVALVAGRTSYCLRLKNRSNMMGWTP